MTFVIHMLQSTQQQYPTLPPPPQYYHYPNQQGTLAQLPPAQNKKKSGFSVVVTILAVVVGSYLLVDVGGLSSMQNRLSNNKLPDEIEGTEEEKLFADIGIDYPIITGADGIAKFSNIVKESGKYYIQTSANKNRDYAISGFLKLKEAVPEGCVCLLKDKNGWYKSMILGFSSIYEAEEFKRENNIKGRIDDYYSKVKNKGSIKSVYISKIYFEV